MLRKAAARGQEAAPTCEVSFPLNIIKFFKGGSNSLKSELNYGQIMITILIIMIWLAALYYVGGGGGGGAGLKGSSRV